MKVCSVQYRASSSRICEHIWPCPVKSHLEMNFWTWGTSCKLQTNQAVLLRKGSEMFSNVPPGYTPGMNGD